MPKKPTNKRPRAPGRTKTKSTGGSKTRPDVPITRERQAASGKRVTR